MTDPEPIGKLAQAWVKSAHSKWQKAAARDPERFLYVPEERPSEAGQVQQRWLRVLGGRQRYATWRLSNVTHHVADRADVAEKWLEKGRRKPLLIEGRESGTGKSSLASAVAYAWWQRGARPVMWAPVAELTTPDSPHAEALARAGALTLVVLDDLTSQAVNWQSFTATVERLHASEARIVTTTNLTPAAWDDENLVDPRVRRRLRDDAERIPMPDWRLNDPAPDGPSMTPCPYACVQGQLIAEDHPDGYNLTERFAADHGYARPVAADAYDDPDRLAELRAEVEREFDALGRTLAVPCPHCSAL